MPSDDSSTAGTRSGGTPASSKMQSDERVASCRRNPGKGQSARGGHPGAAVPAVREPSRRPAARVKQAPATGRTSMSVTPEASAAASAHAIRINPLARQPRALIVDDQRFVVNFVDYVLRDAGYATETALSPVDALRTAETAHGFDLLITDLNMPCMNGAELARRLVDKDPDLKVLYFTGDRQGVFKHRAALTENESVLEKPCTMRELLAAVQSLLRNNDGGDGAGRSLDPISH